MGEPQIGKRVPSLAAPARWQATPQIAAGDRVCLFVALAVGNVIPEHSLFHARAFAAAGFRTIVIVVSDAIAGDFAGLDFAAGVLVRANDGYDFGAWAGAINRLPMLAQAALVATVNDSVYGPFKGFEDLLARVEALPADLVGVTESYERRHHFQSYLLFFKPRALACQVFADFWAGIECGDREFAIANYEVQLAARFAAAGIICAPIFRLDPPVAVNPTLILWRQLLDAGLPYLKVQLLRDNPFRLDLSGWDALLSERDYDPEIVRRHLGLRS